MSYYLAPSLVHLREEIDDRWPQRDRASDGWIGDPSHQARKSDHNPDYSAGGVVRALDVDRDGINVGQVLDAVIGDDRVWYVIFNRNIYSRTYGWAKRRYDGSNPHTKHIHISIRHTHAAETDTTRWLGRGAGGGDLEVLDMDERELRKIIAQETQAAFGRELDKAQYDAYDDDGRRKLSHIWMRTDMWARRNAAKLDEVLREVRRLK